MFAWPQTFRLAVLAMEPGGISDSAAPQLGLGYFCFFPALLPKDTVFVQNNCFPWHLASC